MLNILWGLLQFLWVWSVGAFLLKRLPISLHGSYKAPVAFLLGETVVSYFLLISGTLGGLTQGFILPIASITAFFCATSLYNLLKGPIQSLPSTIKQSPIAAGLAGCFLVIYAIGACAPEREVDSLWYHLFVPQFYLNHGGLIQEVPFNLPSHYPMNAHLHFAVSLLLGNDASAKVFTLCHIIPLMMALAAAANRYVGRQWALPVCVILLACVHYKLPIMANVYRPLQLSLLLSTLMLVDYFESNRRASFYLAAVFCGMAMGTKLTAIVFVFGAHLVLMALVWLTQRRIGIISVLKDALVYSIISWSMLSPWLVKSFLITGNPFFPSLGGLFTAKPEFQSVIETYSTIHGFAPLKADGVLGWAQLVFANIKWALYNNDIIFSLGIVSVLFIPFVMQTRGRYLSFAALGMFLFFPLLWGHAVVRLFSACYPVIALAIAVCLHRITQPMKKQALIIALLLIAFSGSYVINKLAYLHSPSTRWNGEIRLSEPSRRQWLVERKIMPQHLFDMKDWMDDRLNTNETIYSFNSEYPYYLNQPIIFSDELFGEQLHGWLEQGPDEAVEQLRALDVVWFLDGGKHANRPPEHLKPAWNEFRFMYLREEHREGDAVMYRFD